MDRNVKIEANSPASEGFIKIWGHNPKTGESKILINKKNTILYKGSDVLAKALGGVENAAISHMYFGYSGDSGTPGDDYAITKSIDTFTAAQPLGYLRVPLTFPASFTSSDDVYGGNMVVFTVVINSPDAYQVSGSQTLDDTCDFYELALVSAIDPTGTPASHPGDMVFARVAIERITNDPGWNLTCSWAVKFVS